MPIHKDYYVSLSEQYQDPKSLMYKKIRLVDSKISPGNCLLDIGVGVGELIELEKKKFKEIHGIDLDQESINICRKRFNDEKNVFLALKDLNKIEISFKDNFDVITCLDVLEHVKEKDCEELLDKIYELLRSGGIFIFTGPGIFEKIRISLGRSPTHLHSHSSYGWQKIIKKAGFELVSVETVEFPILNSEILRKKIHLFGKCCLIVAKKN